MAIRSALKTIKVVGVSRILAHILLLLLVARMPAAPLAASGVREGHPIGDGLSLSRCVWPDPHARKATARLVALVRESSNRSEGRFFPTLASGPRVDEALGTTSLETYERRALGCPRC